MPRGEQTAQKRNEIKVKPIKPKIIAKKKDQTNHGIKEALKWKKTVKGEKAVANFMGKNEMELLTKNAMKESMELYSILEKGKPEALNKWV